MDWLEVLQTIGICLGSLALVVIAFILFIVVTTFMPSSNLTKAAEELQEFDESETDDAYIVVSPMKSRSKRPRRKL